MGLRDFHERSREWDLDIDHYLNLFIPASPLHRFPTPIARFLGYRKERRQDIGNILGAVWSLVGAFCGLAVVAAVFNNTESIHRHSPPALIASFVSAFHLQTMSRCIPIKRRLTYIKGASAILEYNAIRSPLGQPRNAILGHTFSAIIGTGISKLFQYRSDYESIKWIAGAVACGVASAFMGLTGTVHPPGGASAVLAATEPSITAMGWFFVPLVMWGATLMLAVGLVLNNIQRQFPMYWWTPLDLQSRKVRDEETVPDGRGGLERRMSIVEQHYNVSNARIHIDGAEVLMPDDLSLNAEEVRVLEGLRDRLRKKVDMEREEENAQRDNEGKFDVEKSYSASGTDCSGSTRADI